MKKVRALTTIATAMLLLGATACSANDDDGDSRNTALAAHLCETNIPTSPINNLFPSPHIGAYQKSSHNGSLTTLKIGRKRGGCTVSLTYDRHGIEKTTRVFVDAMVSNDETAKEFVSRTRSANIGRAASQTIQSGEIQGFSGPNGAAVAFPCKDRTDQAQSVRVEVDFDRDDLDTTKNRKQLIATTTGKYAVQIARYLNEHFLKCLRPDDLAGPITTQHIEDQQG